MNGREMSRNTRAKQTNGKHARQQNKQMVENEDRCSPPKEQNAIEQQGSQRQRQCQLNNDFIFNLKKSREKYPKQKM